MIVCVTPNAAIDLTMQLEELHIGAVQRVQASIAVAGGKGVNVARVLRLLGGDSVNAAFLGGAAGRYFVDLAEREGLRGRWTWVDGETRTCVMLAQPRHGDATVVNGQGMLVGSADWERLQHDVAALARESAASSVCLCGSLPPGSPVDAYERLIRTCVAAGLRTWVDTSGAALRAALGVAGAAIKVNRAELMHVLHDDAALSFGTLAEIGHAVRELIARHSLAAVAVTLGAEGAVLATSDGAWAAAAPQVPAFRNNYANALMALGRHADAAEQLRKAVETDPRYERAWLGLALAYTQMGDPERAIDACERGRALKPAWPELARAHAAALEAADRIEESVTVLEAAVAASPRDADLRARLLKAWGFLRTGRKPHPKAQGKPFDITASTQLWQTDMTSIWCGQDRWGYFTAVIDTYDRVLLGWSFTLRCRSTDVSPSLEMAWATAFPYGRDTDDPKVTVRHDNGTQFTAIHHRDVAKTLDLTLSRTAYRHPDGNAFIERMFRTLKEEGFDGIESKREREAAEDLMKLAARYVEVYRDAERMRQAAALGITPDE